ncbi:MAG: T9SS type A sorting domain-containing protein [Flavobacteriales bacterium]|nr:T9SS type A sorting domain-containing protein [Flavobacteriales bacterium]
MKTNTALKEDGVAKWLGYSGMATAFLAMAPGAKGQVVYVDIDPDVVLYHANYNVDFDADGTVDLTMTHFHVFTDPYGTSGSTSTASSQRAGVQFPSGNAVVGTVTPALLGSGDPITTGSNFITDGFAVLANGENPNAYDWYQQTGFIGCRFVGGDGMDHYGWVELSVPTMYQLVVRAYGYETEPGKGTAAGATGSVGFAGNGVLPAWGLLANPVNDRAIVKLPPATNGPVALSLLSPAGEVLFTDALHGQHMYDLPMARYAPGVYFLRLQQGDRCSVHKVVKQ